MTFAAALLAAGAGSRFRSGASGTHKLKSRLRLGGPEATRDVSVGAAALVNMLAAGGDANAIVSGAVEVADIVAEARQQAGGEPPPVTVLANRNWADGIATSLTRAVEWAEGTGHQVLVVGLADQPGITPSAWRAVASAVSQPDAAPVAVATYDGQPANPVALHRSVWPLLPTTGDEGARQLLRGGSVKWSQVACDGRPDDVDTVEDLRKWS